METENVALPRLPMPLMCTSFEPGCLDAAVASFDDPDVQAIARAEALYFRGQAEAADAAATAYLDADNVGLCLSGNLICGFASLSLNHIAQARSCLGAIVAEGSADADEGESEPLRASRMLFGAAAGVLLHLPTPFSMEEFASCAASLPEGLRLFASYLLAHASYLNGDWGKCVGMAENALVMKRGSYPISETFLHLGEAMGYMSLKESDHAREHFERAWALSRPDGLYETIGEHHGLLQGLVEKCLKAGYPEDFSRVIEITYRFSYGWRRIHNPDAGESVADNLSTTEFAVSMLACRGWSNAEIARHMGISAGTVKNRLSSAYAKLGISKRSELGRFMLR